MSKSHDQNENNETTTETETLEIPLSLWSSQTKAFEKNNDDDDFKKLKDDFLNADENKQTEILHNYSRNTPQELFDLIKDSNSFYFIGVRYHLDKKPEESSTETEIIPEKKKSDNLRLPESHTQKKITSHKERRREYKETTQATRKPLDPSNKKNTQQDQLSARSEGLLKNNLSI